MKLETYTTYCVCDTEEQLKERDFSFETEDRGLALYFKRVRGYSIVKACVSCTLNNTPDGVAEFAYGDTVAEARKELRALLRRVYGSRTYTI